MFCETISSVTRLSLFGTRGFASPDYSGFAIIGDLYSHCDKTLTYRRKHVNKFL